MTSTDDTDDDVGQSPKAIIINLPFSLCGTPRARPPSPRSMAIDPQAIYNTIYIYVYSESDDIILCTVYI